jgi:hypothetical protein
MIDKQRFAGGNKFLLACIAAKVAPDPESLGH